MNPWFPSTKVGASTGHWQPAGAEPTVCSFHVAPASLVTRICMSPHAPVTQATVGEDGVNCPIVGLHWPTAGPRTAEVTCATRRQLTPPSDVMKTYASVACGPMSLLC